MTSMQTMQLTSSLSGRQLRLYRFIQAYQDREGRPPTYAEMQAALGISSKSLVRYHLDVLVREGLLERAPAVARGVRPPAGARRLAGADAEPREAESASGGGRASFHVPVVGELDGQLALPLAEIFDADGELSMREVLELTRAIAPEQVGLYAVRVRGNALIDALVRDGDIVVARRQHTAEDGEMVLVRLLDRGPRGVTVLKRWRPEGNRVRLEAADPHCSALTVAADRLEVQGVVVAVIRQL